MMINSTEEETSDEHELHRENNLFQDQAALNLECISPICFVKCEDDTGPWIATEVPDWLF
jgi:hypothetical protein